MSPGAVAVLTALVTEGPMSRADLARRTGLTSAAVTKVVNPLAAAGYLREAGPAGTGGLGRPPGRVEIRGDAAYVVGLKVGDDEVLGVLVDMAARIHRSITRPLSRRDVDHVVDVIAGVTTELVEPEQRERLRHVALGISGGVDEAGLVSYSPHLGWHGVQLAPLVRARLGLPVTVENDVRAFTAGERWFGPGAGRPSLAVITVGAGIGCAVSAQGRVLRGAYGVAGEVGHLPIAGDRGCYCGGVGCLETVATTAAILADVSSAVAAEVTTLDEAVALGRSDERVAEVFRVAGRAIGRGIASVVNLFGPDCVVLSGEGLAALDLIREPMRAGLVEQAYGQAIHCELIIRPQPFEAWAYGAAIVALEAFIRGA